MAGPVDTLLLGCPENYGTAILKGYFHVFCLNQGAQIAILDHAFDSCELEDGGTRCSHSCGLRTDSTPLKRLQG